MASSDINTESFSFMMTVLWIESTNFAATNNENSPYTIYESSLSLNC